MLSERVLKTLWKQNVVGAAILSKDGVFLKINEKLSSILEYTEAELVGKHFSDITIPADQKANQQMANKILSGEIDHFTMTKTYLKKSGYPVQIDLRVDAVRKENNELEFVLSQVRPKRSFSPTTKSEQEPGVKSWYENNKKFLSIALSAISAIAVAVSAYIKFLAAR